MIDVTTRPLVVGLTGGIGSGKSAAAERFAALGAAIVDTDQIAHQLTAAGGDAIPALQQAFGPQIIGADGALDRAAMRALAFGEPSARQRLEGILHPMIRARSDAAVAAAQAAPYVVLVVPLLVESGGYRSRCDRIAVVDVPEALQLERVMRRSGLAREQVEAIMAAQASRAQRRAIADDLIDNSGDIAALQRQVDELDRRYRAETSMPARLS
ncbi:dephospho-CoA kinase [Niveibacterium microcysteis]|uniref:Dephospho-CoA kinase n=1 Tax=Niveibacterium microcysteis TaxID=2811415 RepID=A0ABX7MEA9_9RHOO|nr:dephospho-CoA kinase [Niveibacterium microcysteis]QSI79105.1 dephospho-CoA kinase [Niveibacterium microcysteis]